MNSRLEDCEYGDIEVRRYNLFGFLPLFCSKKNNKYKHIKVLGVPVLKIKNTPAKEEYKLFDFLPILSVKKYVKYPYSKLDIHYHDVIRGLKAKINSGEKIRVCFMVIFDSVFPAKPLFEKMLEDDMFEPFILVIPDKARGDEHMFKEMEKTYNSLSQKYSCVFKSLDSDGKKFIDYSDKMDMVCSANPYETMTNRLYRIGKLCKKNILPIYFNYGYPAVTFARRVASLGSLAKMWKVFSESDAIMSEYAKCMQTHGVNLVLAGYMKLDELAVQKQLSRARKKIIIAPHHTIEDKFKSSIGLSNFLIYADLFKELPKMYPQIDFVFRPHPLLKVALQKDEIWGEEKTKKYFEEITQNPNLIYQDGGDYFETFMNSDGIIHDCSSFLAEYMFTQKPTCYMLRNEESIEKYFMKNGQKILEHCYQAYSKEDIVSFLDNVILDGNDTLKSKRIDFVNKKMMVNYPNVSKFVLDYIKEKLLNTEGEV